MGAYTCIKSAVFAGVKYKPGDTIPAEAIPVNRVGAVIQLGLIAEQQGSAAAVASDPVLTPIVLPIIVEDGTEKQLEVAPETIVEAVRVFQLTAEAAAEHIKTVTDSTALIVIDACDSRKTVKKAAADRAAELEAAAQEAGE